MKKHKHKRKPVGKDLAKSGQRKAHVGHCENPACGEKEPLQTITVQVNGKTSGRALHLCRSCAHMTLARIGDHPPHGGWR